MTYMDFGDNEPPKVPEWFRLSMRKAAALNHAAKVRSWPLIGRVIHRVLASNCEACAFAKKLNEQNSSQEKP